jgi:hypothetical protein
MMFPLSYIDPSSGSLIFQLIGAAILGSLVTIKLWWNRAIDKITGLFGGQRDDK